MWPSRDVPAGGQGSEWRTRLKSLVPDSFIPERWLGRIQAKVGAKPTELLASSPEAAVDREMGVSLAVDSGLSPKSSSRMADSTLSQSTEIMPGDRLEQLHKYPHADVSLREVFELLEQESAAFMKPGFVPDLLRETLTANLNDFPNSARAVQDSFMTLSKKLDSSHSGLLSNFQRDSLVDSMLQPIIDKYLASSKSQAMEVPDIYKIEEGFKRDLQWEELKSFRTLRGVLLDSKFEQILKGASLLKSVEHRDEFEVFGNNIRTFNQLREHTLSLLETHLTVLESSLNPTKPVVMTTVDDGHVNPEVTLRGRSIREHLMDLIVLERDFLQKILLPKYRELMTAIKASANQRALMQDLANAMKNLPASIGKSFMSHLINGTASNLKPFVEAA